MTTAKTSVTMINGKSRFIVEYYKNGVFDGVKMHLGVKTIGYNRTKGFYSTVANIDRFHLETEYLKQKCLDNGITL